MRLTLEAMPRHGRPRRWGGFVQRNSGTFIASFEGRGINFHRKGGVSFTGIPQRGGTTIAWGRLRERCERMDAKQPDRIKTDLGIDNHMYSTVVFTVGPFMVRVGYHF
jgi:hypothetical protein